MRLFLTALLLLVYQVAAVAQATELTALLKKQLVPGVQVIYTKGNAVSTYSIGLAKSGSRQALNDSTTLQAASLGKVVVAYTALRLHDRGLLDLDKPLLTYAPYPRLANEPRAGKITARMVLTHSTGLPNWSENPMQPSWQNSPLRLRYAPDSCFNYSGEAYVWLQKTLEHLSGKSFEALTQQEVFQPLHMANSSFTWRPAFAANAATGHDKTGKPTEVKQFAAPYGAFSLLTNATDYNKFVQAIMLGRGLKPATARLLLTQASAANRCRTPATAADAAIAWGGGVGLATTSYGPAIWHWGNNDDFQGFFMAFPAQRESIVFLTNSANGLKLTDELIQLFLGPGQYWATQWLAEEK
jgi:CubicO group peptidase (beta-lactamase class C family)